MIPVMCIVQDGQVSEETEQCFKKQVGEFTQRAFSATADIDWIVVPKGSGFTAAEPSNTVITSMHSNRLLPEHEHAKLLKELGGICMANSKCSVNEIVTLIRTPMKG